MTWEATHEQYLAHPALSRSAVECYLGSPVAYYEQYEARTAPPQETREQRLGTLLHRVVLHPDFFTGSCVRIPPAVLSAAGARAGKNWLAWKADQRPDAVLLTPAEFDQVQRIVQRVEAHPVLGDLLRAPGVYEQNLRFRRTVVVEGQEVAVTCKARLDKILPPAGARGALVLDLKSTTRPITNRSMAGLADAWGWSRQAAWYGWAVEANYHWLNTPVVFGLVQTVPHFECATCTPDTLWRERARAQLSAAVAEIAARRKSGFWGREDQTRVIELAEPAYRARDAEWETQ